MFRQFVCAGAAVGLVCAAAPASAQTAGSNMADLVVVKSKSTVNFVSCEDNQPLATGTVVIENIGNAPARRGTGGAAVSIIKVYSPHVIDFQDDKSEWQILGPFEAASLQFSIGDNKRKRGRLIDSSAFAGSGGVGDGLFEPEELEPFEVREIQRALARVGLYRLGIDGVYGSGTRAAVRNFSIIVDASLPTDVLTGDLARTLQARSGVPLSIVGGAVVTDGQFFVGGPITFDIFVSVDPFDRVVESNELNNVVRFPITVDCGGGGGLGTLPRLPQ